MSALVVQLQSLLQRVGSAFAASDISQLARAKGYRWNYSLITGACHPKTPLIVGFNWGASAGAEYDPQREIKPSQWNRDDLGSLVRVLPYIARYLPKFSFETVTQTNYCFFRSKEERDITSRDLELCRPLFLGLLALLDPSIVLSFFSRLRDHLLRTSQVVDAEILEVKEQRGNRTVTSFAGVGKLKGRSPVAFLPHPNYPLRRTTRAQMWEFCAKWVTGRR